MDKKSRHLSLMSASPMCFRHMNACADIKSAGYIFVSFTPAIRQNSYGLYIVESYADKIIGVSDRNVLMQYPIYKVGYLLESIFYNDNV